jgi:hypothetical protein
MPSQGQDRAAKARAALRRKIDEQAGGDRELAERLLHEHYREMQRRSAATRRAKRRARLRAELVALRAQGVEFTTEAEVLRVLREQR